MANEATVRSDIFPLDNLTYDIIAVIHEKSKALETLDKYLKDAQGNDRVRQSFEKICRQDQECINELTQHLRYLIGQAGQSGGARIVTAD
jgi:hypothetical protein